jgi:hypothetical protein
VYTLRKDNSRADAFSRRSDIARTKKITKSTILKTHKDKSLEPSKELQRLKISIRIKVPKELQEAIIQQHHDNSVHRHPKVAQTIEQIQRNYQFSGIKDKVALYIKKYADYQRNKHSTYTPYGEMQPIELPSEL